ncbi:MAG TPA: hypothetical protein VMU30_12870 [Bacteroidota bacterium]|nr:hypothetical protein [Bacteroidota bacterium]
MNDKSDDDVLAMKLHDLELNGSGNMQDPFAHARALCQELKTVFLQASDNLPALHLDLEMLTLTDHGTWSIDQFISRISHSLYSLKKEEVR